MYKTRIKEKWWFSQCGRTWLVWTPAEHLWCDFKYWPWAKNSSPNTNTFVHIMNVQVIGVWWWVFKWIHINSVGVRYSLWYILVWYITSNVSYVIKFFQVTSKVMHLKSTRKLKLLCFAIYLLTPFLSPCWEKLGVSAEAFSSAWGLLISLLMWKGLFSCL